MRINKIHLENFKGHKDLELTFDKKLTVIVGENGAGKTSILESVSYCLSWIVARIKNPKGQGNYINKNEITNGKDYCLITSEFDEIKKLVVSNKSFGVAKYKQVKQVSYYDDLNEYVSKYHGLLAESKEISLPIISHYSVNRKVEKPSLKIRRIEKEVIFELYENWDSRSTNFNSFFEWFRNQEDLENERTLNSVGIRTHSQSSSCKGYYFESDRELNTVRQALEKFMPEYSSIRVERKPLRMLINKGRHILSVEQLSDGEKNYITLVGDLCRRLVLANPTMEDPLQGKGIVLIDEIDLHLHPTWQKDIAVRLTEVFPNVQFIISTHSPLVLTNIPSESVRLLKNNIVLETNSLYGLPTSIILKDKMGLKNELPLEVENLISEITNCINIKDIDQAQTAYNKLKGLSPDHPELVRFDFFINRLKR